MADGPKTRRMRDEENHSNNTETHCSGLCLKAIKYILKISSYFWTIWKLVDCFLASINKAKISVTSHMCKEHRKAWETNWLTYDLLTPAAPPSKLPLFLMQVQGTLLKPYQNLLNFKISVPKIHNWCQVCRNKSLQFHLWNFMPRHRYFYLLESML